MSLAYCNCVFRKGLLLTISIFVLTFDIFAEGNAEYKQNNIWEVHPSNHVIVNIEPDKVIRDKLPDTIFGFNVRWNNFEKDLWDNDASAVRPQVIEALAHFPGALYRYPGGLVSNTFHWEDTIGPVDKRKPMSRHNKKLLNKPLFGVAEYFDFVNQVKGHPWYALNLIGHGSKWGTSGVEEYPSEFMAQSNRRLAAYVKNKHSMPGITRYYQLGNELDRNIYQWGHKKYIARSLDSIKAITTVDPDAKFVAFLRQFDWKYTGKNKPGVSRYKDFIKDVLSDLVMINDFSIHSYYDGRLGKNKKFMDIPTSLAGINRALVEVKQVRGNQTVHAWITEHSKRMRENKRNDINEQRNTSNILGTLSSADFLIGIAQIPEVSGASWQALNGVGRQVFDASMYYNDLRPRPIYWGLRVFRMIQLPIVLYTERYSPNISQYEGGYDVNSLAFTNAGRTALGLWVINRSNLKSPMKVNFKALSNQKVKILHYYIAGDGSDYTDAENIKVQLQDEPTIGKFSANGDIDLFVPPMSVSSFKISK